MRILLGVLLTLALITIAYYIYKSYKQKHRLAQIVRKMLIIGLVIVFINIVSLIFETRMVCLCMYAIYFAVSDWLLYHLLQFSLKYIGNEFEKHVKKKYMILLLVADNVSIALNMGFKHLFDVKEVSLFGGDVYHELVITPFFYTHYAIISMLAAFCLITLFYKSFTAPVFYRKKYFTIAIILVVLVVLNICTFQSAFDLSIVGYVVAGIVIYYCTFVYTPQRLLPKTLFMVAKDMSVALFVMDVEGNRLYSNNYALQLLDTDRYLVNKEGMTFEQWCRDQYINSTEEFAKEEIFYRNEEELILKVQLQRMMDSNKHLQGGYFMVQDRTEEINQLKKERYQATHDSLTDLYNKQHFYEKAETYVKRYPHEELLIVCTDIKDFKMINDFMGTKSGDIVLVNFANIIRKRIKGALVYGRLENDHFGILMAKKDFDEALFTENEQEVLWGDIKTNASLPIIIYTGVYEITNPTLPISVMCDRARMAIAQIKGDYHKRVAYYDNVLRERIRHEQELITDLNTAIAEGQLKMYLQPQMSANGKLLGAEALIRWIHPEKGQIMPGDFIPVFEKNGLISDVDRYIWEVACKQLKRWKDAGWGDLYISVNISLKDFYFLNIYQIFTELIKKYDIEPQNLKLEITETAVVMDFKRQMDLITRLRKTGFIVEMDDFGSGYSSLNMLKDIYVDILKIDMAFLRKATDEERSKKILQMIISLSTQLGMPVITEGIENEEQVKFLADMGCNMFQGYHFGKPMSVEEFEKTYLK